MKDNWIIKIIDNGYKIDRDVFVFRKIGDGTEIMQSDGTLKFVPFGSSITSEPTFSLSPEALQELSDELYRNGYKPEKGYEKGKLEAIENHLNDMRRLVFEEKEIITTSESPIEFKH